VCILYHGLFEPGPFLAARYSDIFSVYIYMPAYCSMTNGLFKQKLSLYDMCLCDFVVV
jgi:hypothetical protein